MTIFHRLLVIFLMVRKTINQRLLSSLWVPLLVGGLATSTDIQPPLSRISAGHSMKLRCGFVAPIDGSSDLKGSLINTLWFLLLLLLYFSQFLHFKNLWRYGGETRLCSRVYYVNQAFFISGMISKHFSLTPLILIPHQSLTSCVFWSFP